MSHHLTWKGTTADSTAVHGPHTVRIWWDEWREKWLGLLETEGKPPQSRFFYDKETAYRWAMVQCGISPNLNVRE